MLIMTCNNQFLCFCCFQIFISNLICLEFINEQDNIFTDICLLH